MASQKLRFAFFRKTESHGVLFLRAFICLQSAPLFPSASHVAPASATVSVNAANVNTTAHSAICPNACKTYWNGKYRLRQHCLPTVPPTVGTQDTVFAEDAAFVYLKMGITT